MKKTLLSLIMISSIGIYTVKAQITINDTHIIGAGDDVVQARDTIPAGVTIGSSGANQTWNFSTVLDEDDLDTLKFRNPSGYPSYASFPLSNLVMMDTGEDSSWVYLTKNTGGLFVDGIYQVQNGQGNVIPLTTTIITFPSTMGTSYNGSWNGKLFGMPVGQDLDGPGPQGVIDSIKVTRATTLSSNIDGWGTVTTPFATGGFAALRQIVLEESIDTTWQLEAGTWSIVSAITVSVLQGFGVSITDIAYDTTRTARWWSDDPASKFPVVEMDYEANGTVNSVDWQKSSPTVSVQEQVKTVSGVVLYPSPAKNEITIETGLTNNNSIEILDVTGKLIEQKRFTTDKLTLSVSDLSNGIYFYNIYDVEGNVLYSNKFVVAK
jgi:hypothetical protein